MIGTRQVRWPLAGRDAAAAIVPETPTLWPGMLLPRARRSRLPFPFSAPDVQYFYLARNGVYALAQHLELAGKEVLFPAYFHGVELQALLAAGVRPRFFPVHAGMRVDPLEVIQLITPDTAAVYLTHYLGFPGPVEALAAACHERGIRLIEDCALSLLSCLGSRPLGSFGHAAVFCLYKSLPTPHGGATVLNEGGRVSVSQAATPGRAATAHHVLALLLSNIEFRGAMARRVVLELRRVRRMLGQARVVDRVPTGTNDFDLAHVGLLMSDLCRIIVAAQPFARIVRARRRNYLHLSSELADIAPPVLGNLPDGVCPLSYPFASPRKEQLWAGLRARGVQAVNFWSLDHPSAPRGAFPEVDSLRQTVLELPCHQDLTPTAVERLARVVREVVREVG